MNKIIIKIEKEIFFRTGAVLPALKRLWAMQTREIIDDLERQNSSTLVKRSYFDRCKAWGRYPILNGK